MAVRCVLDGTGMIVTRARATRNKMPLRPQTRTAGASVTAEATRAPARSQPSARRAPRATAAAAARARCARRSRSRAGPRSARACRSGRARSARTCLRGKRDVTESPEKSERSGALLPELVMSARAAVTGGYGTVSPSMHQHVSLTNSTPKSSSGRRWPAVSASRSTARESVAMTRTCP